MQQCLFCHGSTKQFLSLFKLQIAACSVKISNNLWDSKYSDLLLKEFKCVSEEESVHRTILIHKCDDVTVVNFEDRTITWLTKILGSGTSYSTTDALTPQSLV